MRVEGPRLGVHVEECLPDYAFAFEGAGDEAGAAFYKCDATRELHTRFGDMLHRIHDLEVPSHFDCVLEMSGLQAHCWLMALDKDPGVPSPGDWHDSISLGM